MTGCGLAGAGAEAVADGMGGCSTTVNVASRTGHNSTRSAVDGAGWVGAAHGRFVAGGTSGGAGERAGELTEAGSRTGSGTDSTPGGTHASANPLSPPVTARPFPVASATVPTNTGGNDFGSSGCREGCFTTPAEGGVPLTEPNGTDTKAVTSIEDGESRSGSRSSVSGDIGRLFRGVRAPSSAHTHAINWPNHVWRVISATPGQAVRERFNLRKTTPYSVPLALGLLAA